jgi:hypothetical protein
LGRETRIEKKKKSLSCQDDPAGGMADGVVKDHGSQESQVSAAMNEGIWLKCSCWIAVLWVHTSTGEVGNILVGLPVLIYSIIGII